MTITNALETARAAQPDLSELATRADLHALESRILRELRSQMVWTFGMLVGLLGVAIAILKLLP